MLRSVCKSLALSALIISYPCAAEDYDYSQGYIFAQPQIQSVPLSEVSALLDEPVDFESYLDGEWTEATHRAIERTDDQLLVRFAQKEPLTLKDFTLEATAEVEGDSQRFVYLKSTADYHIIGVLFEHDQPGFLAVQQQGEGRYFINTHE